MDISSSGKYFHSQILSAGVLNFCSISVKSGQRFLFSFLSQSIPVWEELMTPLSKRPVDELPWLQLAVGDLDGLSNTLLNIFTLQRMQEWVIIHFTFSYFMCLFVCFCLF